MARSIDLAPIHIYPPLPSRPSSAIPLDSSRFLIEDPPLPNDSPQDVGGGDIFPRGPSNDEATLAAIHPLWRRTLFALLEQPRSSTAAFVLHMVVTFLILTSALVTILETVPALHAISTGSWFGVETMLVVLFTVEYMARCMAWSATWLSLLKWQTSFFGIIDLLAVLPYYIEILLHQDTSVLFRFSILRMFRLLRVFKPFRYNNTILLTIEVMYVSVRRSQHALLAIGFFVVMILVVFSTLLYFAERGTWDPLLETFINVDGDPSQFASIPSAAWFVLVTITTVGYGEITPRSFLGRLVTLPILVFGLLLITLPSFVLGREFAIVWEKMTSRKENEDRSGGAGFEIGNEADSPVATSILTTPFLMNHRNRNISNDYGYNNGHNNNGDSNSNSNHQHQNQNHVRFADLTNRKLAQNQTELSFQISELREVVEAQGEVVRRLVEALGKKGAAASTGVSVGGGGGGGVSGGKGKEREG